ncbi:mas-related G-protein coupled receptor member H-like [Erythrolamprus reginae]|uniref:mas-related G-protein coupled receptor member H-like n=1 Tax=Erythrolamprus reginae TaxID=121349 RepID=UPI00396C3D3A
MRDFEALCAQLGVPLAPKKTEGPATKITFLGIELDSEEQSSRLPLDKLVKIRDKLDQVLGCRKVTLRQLQELAGILNFACRVIVPGRAFSRRLYFAMKQLRLPHHHTCLCTWVKESPTFWATQVLCSSCSSINCRPRKMSPLDSERNLFVSSENSSADYQSSGSSFSTTGLNFSNQTNSTIGSIRRCGIDLLQSNISYNNTKIGETAPNMLKISGISSLYDQEFDILTQSLLSGLFAIICILGLVGNGMTIYLLTYCIKRNSFTTFILNLSIADFGVLASYIMALIFATVLFLGKRNNIVETFFLLCFELLVFTYSASQFLLTAISLDRCVAVLFPLCHRCHRPSYLPALVSGLIWTLTFLLSAVHFILLQTGAFGISPLLYQLIVNDLFCTPLMVVSTVTLLIHARFKLQLAQRKLLTVILLALLCFLFFSLPMNVFYAIQYFGTYNIVLLTIGTGCATLNSSINPLLYFFVGRGTRGKDQPRATMKLALQRVFKDEQEISEEQQTTEENIV